MSERFLNAVRGGDLTTARARIAKDRDLVRAVLHAGGDALDAGSTALHVAAREGQAAMVQLLALHGADLEARTEEGRTALHDAIEHGQPGADPAIRSRDGRTALEIAEAGARAQASFGEGNRPLGNFAGVIGLLRAAGA